MKQGFPKAARLALQDGQLRRNLLVATTTIRGKRAAVIGERTDWEALRDAGEAIKKRVLRHLDRYLLDFESAVQQAGGVVHWARHGDEANDIVVGLVGATGAREVVKVKSLTTDEIRVNDALVARHHGHRDRSRRADLPICCRQAVAHPRPGNSQEQGRDP